MSTTNQQRLTSPSPPPTEQFTITLLGDIMLGRLIDQLLPSHVWEPSEAEIVSGFRARDKNRHHSSSSSVLSSYTHVSPWGNWIPSLSSPEQRSNLILGNLETAVTTTDQKWPNKVFNYRMHPDNIRCLTEAKIDGVSLANNHTLDFGVDGLNETIKTLKAAGIKFAGVGETPEEAERPAEFTLFSSVAGAATTDFNSGDDDDGQRREYKVHLYSFSDHPDDWASIPQFNLLEYTARFREHLKTVLTRYDVDDDKTTLPPALKIVAVHWGPNYRWQPDTQIQEMAHFLIDSCGVDVVWGHSSHHIQGVEIRGDGKLIVYGCGDFVDDYAVNYEYRNDLSAAWTLSLVEEEDRNSGSETARDGSRQGRRRRLRIKNLRVRPNRIQTFQANSLLLDKEEDHRDHKWIVDKFRQLCADLGTKVERDLGAQGEVVVNVLS